MLCSVGDVLLCGVFSGCRYAHLTYGHHMLLIVLTFSIYLEPLNQFHSNLVQSILWSRAFTIV